MKFTICHDSERFNQEIALVLSKGKLLQYVDVISPDGRPDILWAVVHDYGLSNTLYSNAKDYTTYQHAFAAIGAAVDRVNAEHEPISEVWR